MQRASDGLFAQGEKVRYIKRGLFWRIFGRVAEYSIGAPVNVQVSTHHSFAMTNDELARAILDYAKIIEAMPKSSPMCATMWEQMRFLVDIQVERAKLVQAKPTYTTPSMAAQGFDEWWRDHKDKEGIHLTEQQAFTVWMAAPNA